MGVEKTCNPLKPLLQCSVSFDNNLKHMGFVFQLFLGLLLFYTELAASVKQL